MEQNMNGIPPMQDYVQAERKQPNPTKKIGILMLIVVVIFIAATIFFSTVIENMTEIMQEIVLTIFVTGGCVLLPSLIHIKAGSDKKVDKYNLGKLPLNQIIPCILFGLGLCFAMQAIANLLTAVYASSGYDLSKIDTPLPTMRTPLDFILISLCIAVAPAICEEMLCRSAVLYSMRSLGMHRSALWSGLFFALLHLNLTMLPMYVALGYIFGLIAYKTRNVKSTMIVHFVYNFTIISLSAIPAEEESAPKLLTLASGETWLYIFIFSVIAAVFLVPAYFIFRRNCAKNDEAEAAEYRLRAAETEKALTDVVTDNAEAPADKPEITVADYVDAYNDIDAGHAPFGKGAMIAAYVILVLMTLVLGLYQLGECVIK